MWQFERRLPTAARGCGRAQWAAMHDTGRDSSRCGVRVPRWLRYRTAGTGGYLTGPPGLVRERAAEAKRRARGKGIDNPTRW